MRLVPLAFFLMIMSFLTFTPSVQSWSGPEEWIREIETTLAKVDSYTAIFHKQERVNGRLKEKEVILFKFKKPFKVYMKWIEDPGKGREVLYVEGWNNNRIKVREEMRLGEITIDVAPNSYLAMHGSRHPITDAGLENLSKLIEREIRRVKEDGRFRFRDLGEEILYNRKTQKIEYYFPREKANDFYCSRALIWVDMDLKLPIRVQIFGWKNELLESYAYENLRLETELTDYDFDPRNSAYKF